MLQSSTQETRRDARQPSAPLDRHARSLSRRHRRRRPHHPGRGGGALAQGYPYPGATRRHRGDACLGRTARSAAADAEAALGAGADRRRRGLARAARPAVLPHPHLCPRHPPRVDGREHPRRAVPPHQALCRHRGGPEAEQVGPPRRHTARRPDAGHPRPRRHRPAGSADRLVRSACTSSARSGAPPVTARGGEVLAPEQTDEVLARSDFVLLLLPATPETENFINAQRLAQDEAHRLAAELRSRPSDRRRRSDRRGDGKQHCRSDTRRVPPGTIARSSTRSGPPRASSCCPISAVATRSATASWPGCSWTTWAGSSTASLSGRWSIEPQGISATY